MAQVVTRGINIMILVALSLPSKLARCMLEEKYPEYMHCLEIYRQYL